MTGPIAVGVGKIKVNGTQYNVADEIRIMPANEKREPLVGLDGSVAMQVTPQSPYVEASLRDNPAQDVMKLFAGINQTVLVELNNGTSYTLSEAFYSGDAEIDVKDGKVAARWNGTSVQRLT